MSARNYASRTLWTGDNLDIMRGMNSETVDLAYLDPPFNSNRDYAAPIGSQAAGAAFKDTWDLSDLDIAWMGLIADEQPAISYLLDATGKTHSKSMQSYLTMMAVRLLELKRLLKPTASVYLHCDSTAGSYLKSLMDAVFGQANFRNDIIWRRQPAKGLATRNLAANHDILLRYACSDDYTHNVQYAPLDPEYVSKNYRFVDQQNGRRYRLDNLVNPNKDRPNLTYEFLGVRRVWRWTRERMQQAYDDGIVIQTAPGRVPQQKRYLDESQGRPADTLWYDIPPVQGGAKEYVGYPTQKPLALLNRIIAMSSNRGDLILNPFCGCATACVSAENLGREWVGIDISPKAADLVLERLASGKRSAIRRSDITFRDDIPRRDDIDAPRNYRENKHVLFGEQEGRCAGCASAFEFRHFEVDHVIPQAKGGTDHLSNLQLLCGHCNRVKGDRPQEYLVARLKELALT